MSEAIVAQLEQLATDLASKIGLCDRGYLRRAEAIDAVDQTTEALRSLLPRDSIPHRILESRHQTSPWRAVPRNSNGFSGPEDCSTLRRLLETITLIGREYVPDYVAGALPANSPAPLPASPLPAPQAILSDAGPVASMVTGLAPNPAPQDRSPSAVNIAPSITTGAGSNVIVGQANYVTIDTAGPNWRAFEERVTEVLEQIRRSNELAPEEKQQLSKEIAAGVELMKAATVERPWIDRFVIRPLKHLTEKFGSSAVGAAATEAVKWLFKLLGS